MRARPERLQLPDFAGRPISLADGPSSWRKLKPGAKGRLLLGLGPQPGNAPVEGPLLWCEAPRTLELLSARKGALQLPAGWQKIDPARISAFLRDYEVWFYAPGLKLAPDFWGPILAQAALENISPPACAEDFIWLPGNPSQLLHTDLLTTLSDAGLTVCQKLADKPDLASLMEIWNGKAPAFVLSVNFRGLDPEGRIFELCRQLGIPLAVWLVDNPWNILSGITLPWWKQANLFITDPGFIKPLQASGAKNAFFLPLAASSAMLRAPRQGAFPGPPVFVGSSAFKSRQNFFSGLRIAPDLYGQALARLESGELPDFHWWQEKIRPTLWPGREARPVSLGCDECSALRRAKWLQAAMQSGLEVMGDEGWKKYLPCARLHPPVDYYLQLPQIYAGAEYVLNVTSLLLPHSLNQRHFDVWAAGGFLLTDATPGLDIFPAELTGPIALAAPAEIGERVAWLRENPAARKDLAGQWRELIAASHTYRDRVAEICARLNVAWPESRRGR